MAVGHIECQPFVSQLVVKISTYLRYQKWISRFIRVSVVILNATAQIMIGRTIDVGSIAQLHLYQIYTTVLSIVV